MKDATGISFNILARLGRDEFISMESIYRICFVLNYGIEDVMEFATYGAFHKTTERYLLFCSICDGEYKRVRRMDSPRKISGFIFVI